MFKWPWKTQNDTLLAALPWQQGLSQPIFSLLSEDEQQALTALAQRFLQQKKLVVHSMTLITLLGTLEEVIICH